MQRPEISLETWDGSKNDRLGSMHTSDHRRSVWYKNLRLHTFLRGARSFTEEEVEEYDENSISRVKRRNVPMARERSVSDVCEVLALGRSFRGEL